MNQTNEKETKHQQQPAREKLFQEIRKRVSQMRSYTPKVGVFGNSGVGKSSLCNALFGKEIAKISDVEACTREPQEVFVGAENGGIILVDVPGIGEDPARQKEYTDLYKSLVPKLDLVLQTIKADDRNYASALDVYKEVFSSKKNCPPIIFVITQTDKTNDMEDWDYQEYKPGGTQKENILIKERDVSARFEVSAKFIISIAISKKGKSYNLTELVDLVVNTLPNEKKFSFVREADIEIVSKETQESAERGIWDSIKEFAGDAWDSVKDNVVDIIIESAPQLISKGVEKVKGLFAKFMR